MANDPYSRYAGLRELTIADSDGQPRKTLSLRLERAEIPQDFLLHTLTQGETIGYLAWKYYGDERLWWKIADANPELHFALNLEPGHQLRIPLATKTTRISRRRDL